MKIKINNSNVEVKEITLNYVDACNYTFFDESLGSFNNSIAMEFKLRIDHCIDSDTILKILTIMNPLIKITEKEVKGVIGIQKYVIEFNSGQDSDSLLEQLQCLLDFGKYPEFKILTLSMFRVLRAEK